MKTIFIESKFKGKYKIPEMALPKRIGLVSTIQFEHLLEKVKERLIKDHKTLIAGLILGCNVDNALSIKDKVDAFLYIGTGKFHPLEVLEKTKKDVFILDPINNTFSKLGKEELIKIEKLRKGKISKFLSSNKIGIIVSTKPGQFSFENALKLKKILKKESYIFITNEVREERLEDFSDIQFWVNTACSRIEEKNIINLEDLAPILKKI